MTVTVAVAVAVTALTAASISARNLPVAVLVAALPATLLLLLHPVVPALLAVAVLPLGQDLSGGSAGLQISATDLLVVVSVAGVVTRSAATRSWLSTWGCLKPLRAGVLPYAMGLAVLFTTHPQRAGLTNGLQRVELVGGALVVGAVILSGSWRPRALTLYAIVGTVFAVAWPLVLHAQVQKNPAGQFIAGALLLTFALRPLGRFSFPAMALQAAGLLLTASRGALLGVAVGLVVVVLVPHGHRARSLLRLLPLVAIVALIFSSLPDDAQQNASGSTAARQYSVKIREAYKQDAEAVIRAHPYTGVGVGAYLTGDRQSGTQTTDPHEVLLLQAAEGGVGFVALFLILILQPIAIVSRRQTALAAAAAAVQVSTVIHGLVDVYWVRGTPLLGWLLIGMAVAEAPRRSPRR